MMERRPNLDRYFNLTSPGLADSGRCRRVDCRDRCACQGEASRLGRPLRAIVLSWRVERSARPQAPPAASPFR